MGLDELLHASRATASFRVAVEEFRRTGMPSDRIGFDARSPAVKVERVLTKLLESEPELPIERVHVAGRSGCEFYRGELVADTANERRRFSFHWDCRWRAVEEGWTDYFGLPDQIRAAREFGHDCFRDWSEIGAEAGAA